MAPVTRFYRDELNPTEGEQSPDQTPAKAFHPEIPRMDLFFFLPSPFARWSNYDASRPFESGSLRTTYTYTLSTN
jgi:hypothetical protein